MTGAYNDLLASALPAARARPTWEPSNGPLPALFVSHGAPPTLDDPQWVADLFTWGASMPKPRGIVMVSAHWEDAPVAISSPRQGTPLVYDFGGFHPRYYSLTYDTPDASALAAAVRASLAPTTTVYQHGSRGLDHGAYVPLMAMFPAADVPVIQVSMPSVDPAALLAMGERLRELRHEGILVVGSGFMTHSFAAMADPALSGYTSAFDEWVSHALSDGDVDALVDYRHRGPGATIAHPTADHFVPLLLTLGAADDPAAVTTAIDRMVWGNSIRSIAVA